MSSFQWAICHYPFSLYAESRIYSKKRSFTGIKKKKKWKRNRFLVSVICIELWNGGQISREIEQFVKGHGDISFIANHGRNECSFPAIAFSSDWKGVETAASSANWQSRNIPHPPHVYIQLRYVRFRRWRRANVSWRPTGQLKLVQHNWRLIYDFASLRATINVS